MSKRGLYACFHSFIHWFILIMIRVSCTRLRACLTDSAAHQSPSIQLSIYIHWMHVVQSLFFVNCSPAWIALSLIVHQNIRVIIIQSFCHKCRSVQYSPSIDRSSLAGLGTTGGHPLHTNWWLLSSASVCMSIHQDDLYIVPQPVCLPALYIANHREPYVIDTWDGMADTHKLMMMMMTRKQFHCTSFSYSSSSTSLTFSILPSSSRLIAI